MNENQKNKIIIGGIYGITAAIVFSYAAAGYNASQYAKAHIVNAWLAYILLAAVTIPICVIAGTLSIRFGSTAKSALIWLLAGFISSISATLLPLWLVPTIVANTNPVQAPFLQFSWEESFIFLLGFSTAITLVAFVILGMLENSLVDSAYYANSAGAVLPALLVSALLAGIIGGVADALINRPIRQSVMALEKVISFQLAHLDDVLPKETSRAMRLSSLRQVKPMLDQNWKMYLASVDLTYSETHILLETNGQLSLCYIFTDQVSNCMPQTNK